MNIDMKVVSAISVFLVSVIAMVVIFVRLTRCIHAWELVDKTELPSGFENMAKAGVKDACLWPSDYHKMAMKTVILALRCPKCGAARIYKESA